MPQDPDTPEQAGRAPAVSPMSEVSGGGAPPCSVADSVPPILSQSGSKPFSARQLLALLLSLCLGVFLADAVISLADDSLILFFNVHLLAGLRAVVFLFAFLVLIVTYVLMGVTPMIPKRFFLPLTLFCPVVLIVSLPLIAIFFGRLQQAAWLISFCQVLLALGILCWVQRGFRLRWPLIADGQLGSRPFSWLNLSVFLLVNVFVLLPLAVVMLFFGASLGVHHLSDGFMALRPGGLTVQVREYVRDDGTMILLVPMAHIGESDFYRDLSQSFPTNALLLMEGVTDNQRLLTNRVNYARMATSLGLAEQQEEFKPITTKMVSADVDVEEFTSDTIDFLNRVMLGHSKGMTPEVVADWMQYSPQPGFEEQLFDDLLGKRNQRLLEELNARLSEEDIIIVPWGAAHMPGIAKGVEASGFHLGKTRDYFAIRFGSVEGNEESQ